MNKFYILFIFFALSLLPGYLFGNTLNNKNDSIQGSLLYNIGTDYYSTGHYHDALNSFLKSLEHRKKYYGEKSNLLASLYLAIGNTYKQIGQYDIALKNISIAEKLYIDRFGENNTRLIGTYQALGNIYRGKLNYPEALRYFEQNISILKNQDDY